MSADAVIRIGGETITVVQRGAQGPRGFSGPDLTDLAASDGADQIGFGSRTVADVLGETVRVTDQGADPTGVAASQVAFNTAAVAAGVGGCIIVPHGTYKIDDVVDILAGQRWVFESATLMHTDDTKTILRASGKDNWSIEGNVYLEGLLVTAASTTETGLRITNCNRFRVSGLTAGKFKGVGIWIDGSTGYAGFRGARGQFTNCATHESTMGLRIDAGGGAEYNTWTNFSAGGNITGVEIGAGNNTFTGGNIVDNETGVHLVAGSNHGHGAFIGTNINHNNVYNLHAVGVVNGYTFLGCHFYANASGSLSSILLDGCKGIIIQGGIIDCWLINDSGTGSGLNKVIDNYFPDDYGVQLFSDNGALGDLYLRGNFLAGGDSELNDAAAVYVDAFRNTTAQSFTSGVGTVVVFNSETRDKGADYDAATGIFTAPVAGFYEVSPTLTVGASGGFTTAGYMTVVKNAATEIGYVPVVPVSATLGVGSGTMTVQLNAGETAKVFITVTATSPNVTVAQSRVTIRLLG